MRKQFTTALLLFALSLTFTGCGRNTNITPETTIPPVANETIKVEDDSEIASETEDELLTEVSEETVLESEESTDSKNSADDKGTVDEIIPEAPQPTSKPEASTKPQETPKPSTKPEASTKPETSVKPEASTKPETSVKPEASTPPVVTPTPEATPEASPEGKVSPSASDVFTNTVSGIELPNQMEVDSTLLQDLYGLDSSLFESYIVKMPMMSFHITEIGVFKVKDVNNVDKVVTAINNRAQNVGQSLYPSLLETFDARQIATNGNYILFALADEANAMVSNFHNSLK